MWFPIFLAVFLAGGCAHSPSAVELSIITATPIEAKPTGYYLDNDCCDGCLCHGTDIYVLALEDVRVIFGDRLSSVSNVEILDGFLRFDWAGKRPSTHLLVIRKKPNFKEGLPLLLAVEADPVVGGQACTWQRLEDYANGSAPFLSFEAMDRYRSDDSREPYCYEVSEIRSTLADA